MGRTLSFSLSPLSPQKDELQEFAPLLIVSDISSSSSQSESTSTLLVCGQRGFGLQQQRFAYDLNLCGAQKDKTKHHDWGLFKLFFLGGFSNSYRYARLFFIRDLLLLKGLIGKQHSP